MNHTVDAEDMRVVRAKYPDPEFTVEDYCGQTYYCVLDGEEMSENDPLPLGFGWTLEAAVAEAALRIKTGLDEGYRNDYHGA